MRESRRYVTEIARTRTHAEGLFRAEQKVVISRIARGYFVQMIDRGAAAMASPWRSAENSQLQLSQQNQSYDSLWGRMRTSNIERVAPHLGHRWVVRILV